MPVYAQDLADADKEILPTMFIEGEILTPGTVGVKPDMGGAGDAAVLLHKVPGANVNSNGPLTGIAQYRGLFGDRVNVITDGTSYKSACSNAMDAPLSHVPAVLTEVLSVKRGIASVSSGIETLGGNIVQKTRSGEFAVDDDILFSGRTSNGYSSVNTGYYVSLFANIANQNHKIHGGGSREAGDSFAWSEGVNRDSSYERNVGTVGYGFQTDDENHQFDIGYNYNDTHLSGTPSLPMDIVYSNGGVTNLNYNGLIADKYKLTTEFSYQDVEHQMNNYTLRGNVAQPARRQSDNTAEGFGYKATFDIPLFEGNLLLGVDGDNIEHNAVITNPFNQPFKINNFNDVTRDRYGFFTEWKGDLVQDWALEIGTRLNWVRMNAGTVSGTGAPIFAPGKPGTQLAADFNASDRLKNDVNLDVVAALTHYLSSDMAIELGFGRKTRSPSYQERYGWLPLNATGGLADGRNYIGNVDLTPETSYQVELGFDWQGKEMYLTPRAFYRYVDNYIQGTPTQNQAALAIDPTTLEFSNINAQLYGVDMEAGYRFLEDWRIDFLLSYVRGERTDAKDNLYRIAPVNGKISFFYDTPEWLAGTELVGYGKQTKTAAYNDEPPTAGYILWNLRMQYRPQYKYLQGLQVGFGIENLLDKGYRIHLNGLNRNPINDGTAIGQHLPGQGRNFYATLSYDW
ncbi:hypothetical protein AU255_00505 [Methyloprofundus sedimenti]|uniref:TonB-dependent receptor n=2 Tax=Methyloprofundus sedimenti TaxID=1420851 RepID=A0A1V8MAP0_9GAMM|nr:hypothetical protein AU255_00505 [Methyloprofundus sedimenti]